MPEPDDPADVAADDQLMDDLIAGATPPTHDQATQLIAAWRREAAHVSDPWIYRRLADERLMDVPDGAGGTDPATTMLPATVRAGGEDGDRVDGWCEDRSPDLGEITRNDGED